MTHWESRLDAYASLWANQERGMHNLAPAASAVAYRRYAEGDINVPVPRLWHFGPPRRGWGKFGPPKYRGLSGLGDAQADAERFFDQASQAFLAGDFSRAADLFGRADAAVPSPEAKLMIARSGLRLGQQMFASGQVGDAITVFQGALSYAQRAWSAASGSLRVQAGDTRLALEEGIARARESARVPAGGGGGGAVLPLLGLGVGIAWLFTRR